MANDYNTERLFGELFVGDLFQSISGVLMEKVAKDRAKVVDKPLFRQFRPCDFVFVSHMDDHLNDPTSGIVITKSAK